LTDRGFDFSLRFHDRLGHPFSLRKLPGSC
jgi:hypothetical protein